MIELSTPLSRDTQTTILATNVTQDSTLTPNEFALCLRALLRPSSALSPCEFAACKGWSPLLFPQELHSTAPGLENQSCTPLGLSAVASLTTSHILPLEATCCCRARAWYKIKMIFWLCFSHSILCITRLPLSFTILLQLRLSWWCGLSCSCESSRLNQQVHRLPSKVEDSTANTPRWV